MAWPISLPSAFLVEWSSVARSCSERSTSLAASSLPTTVLYVGAEVRPIALSWYAESPSDSLDAADRQDHAAPRHLVAPFVRLTARTEGGQMGLLIAPIDPQMPQLMRLNDHSHMASMLKNLTSDSALLSEATRIEAVRYRPGQRHVLHVSSATDPHCAALIKIDRDNRGAQAVRFAEAVGPLLSEHSPNTSLVRPLGYSVEDQAAVWRGIAGTTMSQEVRDPAQAAQLFSLIGKAVRVLHGLDCQTTTFDMTASQIVSASPCPDGAGLHARCRRASDGPDACARSALSAARDGGVGAARGLA